MFFSCLHIHVEIVVKVAYYSLRNRRCLTIFLNRIYLDKFSVSVNSFQSVYSFIIQNTRISLWCKVVGEKIGVYIVTNFSL